MSFIIKWEKEGFHYIMDSNTPTILRVLDQSEEVFFSEVAQLATDTWSDCYFGEITLTIGDPYMLVDKSRQRIDSTNQISPVIINNVILIPVAALNKAIGGLISVNKAQQSITISIDGKLQYVDTSPVVINDNILLSLDIISDKLGFEVKWNPKTQQVTVTRSFQTKRLVLRTSSEVDLMNLGAINAIKGPNKIAVLQFATIQKAQKAYKQLSELEAVVWVEPDSYAALIE